jgi:hypothetical protein
METEIAVGWVIETVALAEIVDWTTLRAVTVTALDGGAAGAV